MKYNRFLLILAVLLTLAMASSCEHIDNKAVPSFTVRIDLGNYALWNTYGVNGMADYRIFDRLKNLPSNFPLWMIIIGALVAMTCRAPLRRSKTLPYPSVPTTSTRFAPAAGPISTP